MTLLIPPIRPLTTVVKTPAIPSFIPSNIFPPVLNTSLTACQALENIFLNQSATFLNGCYAEFGKSWFTA